jgi:succinate-acetate transporter protein
VNEVKIANPGPLGLSGFALTTLILSLVNAGLIGGGNVAIVLGLALFYGGLAQLLAGMWEFRSGNTFGATAFSSYGAFWLSFAALFVPGLGNAKLAPDSSGLGWYLLAWGIVTAILTVASFRTNGATAVVFILLTLTFVLLAIGNFQSQAAGSGMTQIGGYVGIITAIAAWYACFAGVLAGVNGGKNILPVFPLTRA